MIIDKKGRFVKLSKSQLFELAKERFICNAIHGKSDDDCWDWKGELNIGGYGRMSFNSKSTSASRFSWILFNGEIPDKLFVLHRCDNRKCTNPKHLYLGTHNDNMSDAKIRKRMNPQQGELSKKSKLTEAEVRSIIREFGLTKNKSQLAKKYHISRTHLYLIANNKRWSHLNSHQGTP